MTDKQLIALTKKALKESSYGVPLKDYMDQWEVEAALKVLLDFYIKTTKANKGETK